jgi:hypothetical protein
MKKYEIWCNGYAASGDSGKAWLMGEWEGEDFVDAVKGFFNNSEVANKKRELYPGKEYTWKDDWRGEKDPLIWWGCGLHDNEAAARKQFG